MLNTIFKKLNLKKYLVLNLIYISIVSTLFGIFIDYPFEKYDRVFTIKKKFEFSGKFKSKLSEGYLNFNRPRSLLVFRETIPNQKSSGCRIDIQINQNYIEFMFLSFESNDLKCFEILKKNITNSYINFITSDKKMLYLSDISSESKIWLGFSRYEVINFYRYHMEKNLFFFDNFTFDEDKILEKRERIPLISMFKNTILFFIMPIWIFIIFRFIKHILQSGLKE